MSKHRAESMDVRMWRGRTPENMLPLPQWMMRLRASAFHGQSVHFPRLAYLQPKLATTYGGRYFPTEHAIGIFAHKDHEIVKVVLLHEFAHALLGPSGHNGAHDDQWEHLALRLYARYRASIVAIRQVDHGE